MGRRFTNFTNAHTASTPETNDYRWNFAKVRQGHCSPNPKAGGGQGYLVISRGLRGDGLNLIQERMMLTSKS